MPRHLISDAHEWINEIPTVPTHSLVKLQPSQRSWVYSCVNLYLFVLPFIGWGELYCVTFTQYFNWYAGFLCFLECGFFFTSVEKKSCFSKLGAGLLSIISPVCATAGQEDPFELDSNLSLSSGRHGEDRKRQYLTVQPWNTATWRFGWLTAIYGIATFFLCSYFSIRIYILWL